MDNLGFIYEGLDLKLLILFVLSRLPDEVTSDRLLELCQSDSGVGYFDFSVCLTELQESGQVTVEEDWCVITERGRRNIALVENSLPYSVRRRAEEVCAEEAGRMTRNSHVLTRHAETESGLMTELALDDGISEIFHLSILCADEVQAKKIEKKFRRHAEDFYQNIITMLSE